jgi:hypothetical protein
MENLKIELQKFDHERFNYHFSNLIDIGITSSRTDEMMDTLSFIDSCQRVILLAKEKLEKLPDETHCDRCADKEKTIQILEELNDKKDEVINAQHNAIFGKTNNLKVCKK